MKVLIGLFHFVIFLLGATIRLSTVRFPNTLMLISRVITLILLIYLII
jgi:hypothetical protein